MPVFDTLALLAQVTAPLHSSGGIWWNFFEEVDVSLHIKAYMSAARILERLVSLEWNRDNAIAGQP